MRGKSFLILAAIMGVDGVNKIFEKLMWASAGLLISRTNIAWYLILSHMEN